VRCFGLTVANIFDAPRMPPSREKANNMRLAEVTGARPHSRCDARIAM